MSVEQTPQGPRHTHAERVTLAAGLTHPAWWAEVRHTVEPCDYSHVEHQRIADALDELTEIGPFVPTVLPDYTDMAVYWPSSLHVRVHAVATFTDLNPAPILAVAKLADGRHHGAALLVRQLGERRREILRLRYRLQDLTE